MKGWKKIFHANGNKKKAGVAILIPDTIQFKTKTVTTKKGYYIMTKVSQKRNKRKHNSHLVILKGERD